MENTHDIFNHRFVILAMSCICLATLLGIRKKNGEDQGMKNLQYITNSFTNQGEHIQNSFNSLGELLTRTQRESTEIQDKRLQELNLQLTQRNDMLQKTVNDTLCQIEARLKTSAMENEQKLELIRSTMEKRITAMQEENSKKLEKWRATVDEKLQKTLEDRISKSFQLVSDRLEQVYKGLGEMQNLASGVGDLKKVLSNVKTRGILGEIQLGAILEQMLSPEQYEENIVTRKGSSSGWNTPSSCRETRTAWFTSPSMQNSPWIPIQSWWMLNDTGNPEEIEQAVKMLERSIKSFAKSITTNT
jgi:DNA recombination protein RmuC